jgi:hypothetical protein
MDERVLGFDAREIHVPNWLQERRHQYLLRPEVELPLSVDDMVWPSVFSHPRIPGAQELIGLDRPDWIGPISDLWDDLGRLTTCLNHRWGTTWLPCRLIAVTLIDDLCTTKERQDWNQRIVGITPPVISKSWEFLGYDIGDMWLLSGLSNCGYMPEQEDVRSLRDRWAPHLNDHHLFVDLQQAADFKAVSNQRVEEHAPFFVYGIYSIPRNEIR